MGRRSLRTLTKAKNQRFLRESASQIKFGMWHVFYIYNEINPSSIPRLTASVRLEIPSFAYKDER